MSNPTALILGASAGVGRALAAQMAARGSDLLLLARDPKDLEAVASDCRLRYGVRVSILEFDLAAPDLDLEPLQDFITRTGSRVDWLFITAGASSRDDHGAPPNATLTRLLRVNYQGPAMVLTLAAKNARAWKLKTLLVCSSIAAAAPRRRNIAYASSKSALETFALGLRHALAAEEVKVQIYVLGYIDTGLSFGQKLLLPIISPERTASVMARDRDKEIGRRFYPAFWKLILLGLTALPWRVYRRLSF